MINLTLLKSTRKALGMSQMRLARNSGISLPMIQLIETGKTNPSMRILEKLADCLFLRLDITGQAADWNVLVELGLPLQEEGLLKGNVNKNSLKKELIKACIELQAPNKVQDYERKKLCIESMILAMIDHYPSFFKKEFGKVPAVLKFNPKTISGKHIKLRRIALERISRHL